MPKDLFQKVVFGSTVDAECSAQIVKHLYQAEDHPTLLAFPESLYLKGFFSERLMHERKNSISLPSLLALPP